MKTLVIVFLAFLIPVAALAVIDPDPDLLGIYFDTQADINCLQVDAGRPFYAYVILTNPTFAGIEAFEFGYENEFDSSYYGMLAQLGAELPPGAINVGDGDATTGNYVVGLASPVPPSAATILVTWQYLVLDKFLVLMYLGPSSPSSGDDGLPVVQSAGTLASVETPTGNVNLPVAAINGPCGEIEGLEWGTFKSTFR